MLPLTDLRPLVILRVGVLDGDVVAEEPRPLAAGVGDQGLGLVEFQPEVSRRNSASLALICSASALGPVNPSR